MASDLDMGVVAEGLLCFEHGGHMVKGEKDGRPYTWSLVEALAKYEGQEVRVVIVTFDTINKVAELVAQGGLKIEDTMVGKSG